MFFYQLLLSFCRTELLSCKMWRFVLILTILSLLGGVRPDTQCHISNGQCTYHVQLSHPAGSCGRDNTYVNPPAQNDYSRKMNVMQKDFHDVKEDHEKRIRELENVLQKVVLGSLQTIHVPLDKTLKLHGTTGSKFHLGNAKTEDKLLSSLHTEFTALREKLRVRSDLLFLTEKKLNDSLKALEQSQNGMLQTNRALLNAEDNVGSLREENFVLKSELKDATTDLMSSTEKLNETETTLQIVEKSLEETMNSEAHLKEQLASYKKALNETTQLFDKTLKQYNDLMERHAKTLERLRRREGDLMDCYTAKTATFCGFEDENNLCGFTQENDTDYFNWTRARGSTPSSNTGPERDHTCGSPGGHFMFVEASSRGKGQNAIMYSPNYRGLKEQCLEFYYHMYGKNIGTLNVYTRVSGNEISSVWRAYGNQGNFWILSRLYIPENLARAGYQLAFEGITEAGFQGDIAIDDVSVTDGACPVDPNVRPVVVKIKIPAGIAAKNETTTQKPPISKEEKKRRRKLRKLRQKIAEKLKHPVP